MKKVFLIRMSEDGNFSDVFTNVKALYNGILETGYKAKIISVWDYEKYQLVEMSFNYNNLLSTIRLRQNQGMFVICSITCDGRSELNIEQLTVRSK